MEKKKKKLPLCLDSLPAMRALVVLAIVLLAITTPCSDVQAAAHDDATVAHPDGSRGGRWPPAPFGNPARGYDVPPPPQQQQRGRRLLHRAGGRSGAGAGRDE
ncbi:uncharacterized protein LOC120674358 isoform X2 [Panicum virgatum]|uniref:Uncharacterized protein n=1 Tax=Panicum virgatum TaxID=38727 RepID=A0A8T0RN03_PANVG|nr:uncharacterized protein LOC120674358 isoform X2 [Panicum virgatum]KAG2587377.1 hypothetical protein PVAP13_5NG333900 [Panicum virgatum]